MNFKSAFVIGRNNSKEMSNIKNHPRYDKKTKFAYSRPEFLQLRTDDEIGVSADHLIRPIILPRDSTILPWNAGYAECINAGKSPRNEDQAAWYQNVIIKKSSIVESHLDNRLAITIDNQLPWVYFGMFDGHAGPAVAVAAAAQLHEIITEKLNQISDLLFILGLEHKEFGEIIRNKNRLNNKHQSNNDTHSNDVNIEDEELDRVVDIESEINGQQALLILDNPDLMLPHIANLHKSNITVDSLITGVLESAFWEMDALIGQDKQTYQMAGGCTALVSLFILGKVYVCNAGDSRAIISKRPRQQQQQQPKQDVEQKEIKNSAKIETNKQQPDKNDVDYYKKYVRDYVVEMSYDFTPITERNRLLRMAMERPHLLGNEYTHLQFAQRPSRNDLGMKMLYKDAYMTGWSLKAITYDDLKVPLVWGEGKRSRLLATIGVTRGFGDHELKASYGNLPIKPFLTCEPEVRIFPIEDNESLTSDDVLIMATDGLWDNVSNYEAANIVQESFNHFTQQGNSEEARSKYRFVTAAQDLVIHSRGYSSTSKGSWRTEDGFVASSDDISVFVIPLEAYKSDHLRWSKFRKLAQKRKMDKCRSAEPIDSKTQGRSSPNSNSPYQNGGKSNIASNLDQSNKLHADPSNKEVPSAIRSSVSIQDIKMTQSRQQSEDKAESSKPVKEQEVKSELENGNGKPRQ